MLPGLFFSLFPIFLLSFSGSFLHGTVEIALLLLTKYALTENNIVVPEASGVITSPFRCQLWSRLLCLHCWPSGTAGSGLERHQVP
jgi:hypothetical protein